MKKIDKEQLTLIWSSLFLGFIIVYLVCRNLSFCFFILFFVISAICYISVKMIITALSTRSAKACSDIVEYMKEINKLSIQQVSEKAKKILSDKNKFICIESEGEPPKSVSRFGIINSEFFKKYKKIKIPSGDAVLGWDLMGSSKYDKDYIRIGLDTDFIEYAVKPHDDNIYELGEGIDQPCSAAPTIYHLVLILNKATYDD